MNYKMILNVLGKALILEAFLLAVPMSVGFIYAENNWTSFIYPIAGALFLGFILSLVKPKEKSIYVKEGFVIVALVWVLYSLVGAVPFVLAKNTGIPNYVDAFFETVSGFTTTGASILSDLTKMSKAHMFWRLFTHWIGGMGVLVFVLALLPKHNSGLMHLFRAESPGPSPDKLVGKIKQTARILYGIYIALTVLQIILLLAGGMPLYDSVVHSFSVAGTGGFSMYADSIVHYNNLYFEIVMAIFMFLFGVNFNVFYLILIGKGRKGLKSEELKAYTIIVIVSTILIAVNILGVCASFAVALRYSIFQVTSVSSTTGLFSATNFNEWPTFSRAILLVLSCIGGCAGSTGGGIKVIRLSVLSKSIFGDLKKMIRPRSVNSLKIDGEALDGNTERNVRSYFIFWVLIIVLVTLLLSAFEKTSLFTNLSSTISSIGNVGFNVVGSDFCYGVYSPFGKILLSFVMLAGRLEIFPLLLLFMPRTWRKA